jgi:hypothetical protein
VDVTRRSNTIVTGHHLCERVKVPSSMQRFFRPLYYVLLVYVSYRGNAFRGNSCKSRRRKYFVRSDLPFTERSIVEERMRFVLRLKDGENMASLCREFGISRVTGYKIYERYKECGLEGLTDRARTPYRYANKLPAQLETMIVAMRREKPTWGARKLRVQSIRRWSAGNPPT